MAGQLRPAYFTFKQWTVGFRIRPTCDLGNRQAKSMIDSLPTSVMLRYTYSRSILSVPICIELYQHLVDIVPNAFKQLLQPNL